MCIRDRDHIARCVESIRRQTYRNLEILLPVSYTHLLFVFHVPSSFLPAQVR